MFEFMGLRVRTTLVVSAAAVLLGACGGEPLGEESESGEEEVLIGTIEQALCRNDGGVNGVLAALAVASANEMHRWLPTRDFQWNASTGMLELSKHALPRCRGSADTLGCPNAKALLDLQNVAAHGKVTFPGNVKLDSAALRRTLKSYWDSQVACNAAGKCPVDYHDLKFHHTSAGPCGTRYFYDAFEMGTTNRLTAEHAARFSNQLLFLGHPTNPFLAYSVEADRASVDPTYGLSATDVTTAGSCSAVCTLISTTSRVGACCSCNGATKRFARSSWNPSTYVCQ